jgi:Lipocalin-like domain
VTRLCIAALSVALVTNQGMVAQSRRDSFQGVWRIVEATITGPGARTIAFGERPNLTIIAARHYSRVEVQADGPRPILADVTKASADELRAVWGPFVGEAGTYEVAAGNLITMRPIASKNPAVMGPGVFITYTYKLDGDMLTLTQQRNQNGPFPNPFTLKLVRVE